MNCHHARQLISPYLDHQLTGREMLVLQQHLAGCGSCDSEMRSIQQVKRLLRSLHEPRPRPDLPSAISLRIAESDQPLWRVLCLPTPRPQRGRRLATALALSCFTVLSFAASLAPASRDGALTSSGFLMPVPFIPPQPSLVNGAGMVSLAASETNIFLLNNKVSRREQFFGSQNKTLDTPDWKLPPLTEQVAPSYVPNRLTFTNYRTR